MVGDSSSQIQLWWRTNILMLDNSFYCSYICLWRWDEFTRVTTVQLDSTEEQRVEVSQQPVVEDVSFNTADRRGVRWSVWLDHTDLIVCFLYYFIIFSLVLSHFGWLLPCFFCFFFSNWIHPSHRIPVQFSLQINIWQFLCVLKVFQH